MAALGDCFKTLEETLSKRVEDVVKEYHLASQVEARDELDRKMHALFDAELPKKVHDLLDTELHRRVHDILDTELQKRVHDCFEAARDHLMQSVSKAVEEKIKGLSTRHATAQIEMEAKAKEIEAFRVEIDEIREDLISRQQALEEYRNRAVECVKRQVELPSEDYSAPPISTAPSASTVEKAELELTFGPDEEQASPEPGMIEGPLLPSTQMANLSWDRPTANASKSRGGRGRRVYWALVVVSLSLLAILAMAVCNYPFLTLGILCMMCLWLLYLCGEEPLIQIVTASATHGGSCQRKLQMLASALRAVQGLRSSHEKEHRIKALLYSLGVCVLIFNPEFGLLLTLFDSSSPIIGLAFVAAAPVTTTWIAHRIVQIMHARSLRRHGVEQPDDAPVGSEAVQEAMRVIAEKLQERGRRKAQSERKILEILSDKAMLNELVERMAQSSDCSLRRLLEHFKETSPHGVPRSELIELLCMHRTNYLSVRAKSALLHTLMVMRLSSCSNAEACVESLLLSVGGDDLSDLKSMQDGVGDIHSMHKLIFQDLTDLKLRREVLNHFLAEGTAQVAHRALMASSHFRVLLEKAGRLGCTPKHLSFFQEAMQVHSPGRPRSLPSYHGECGHSWLKIITDMDDTLQCSAARWPAGIDARYPRHACYPGVTAFYRELQGGGDVGQLVALSARPHIVGDYMENRIFARFRELNEKAGLHTMPALLPGSVDAGGKFLFSGGDDDGMRALADKKLESFEQYLALYPEFRIVFIGDNGQADYDVGQRICRKYPHNVEQVWIHEVQEQSKTWRHDPDSDAPVAFFEDYIMAAVSAATRPQPLITPEGLRRIVLAAREDFKNVKNWPSEGHREAEAERLNQSILRARDVLSALGVDEEVELILDEKQKAGPSDEEGNQSGGKESDPETARPDPERRSFIGIARGLAKDTIKGTMAARLVATARRPLPAPAPAKADEPAYAEEATQTTATATLEALAPGAAAAAAAGEAPEAPPGPAQAGAVADSPSLAANESPPAAAAAQQQRPGIFGGLVSGLVSGSSQTAPAVRITSPLLAKSSEPPPTTDGALELPPPAELPPLGDKAAGGAAPRDQRDQSPPLQGTSLDGSSSTGRSLLGFGWTKLSSAKASSCEEEVAVMDGQNTQQPVVVEDTRPNSSPQETTVEPSAGSGARSLFGITFGLGSAPQPAASAEAAALPTSEASGVELPASSDVSDTAAGATLQQRAEMAERQLAELQESRLSLERSKVSLERLLAGRDVELLELRARLAAMEEGHRTPPGAGGQAPGGTPEAEPQESSADREVVEAAVQEGADSAQARPATGADAPPVSQRTSLFQGVARAFTGSAARGSPARRSARGSPTSSPVCASPDRSPVDLQSQVGADAQDPTHQSGQAAAEPTAGGGVQEQQLNTVAEELGEVESTTTANSSATASRAFFGGLTRGLAKHGSTSAAAQGAKQPSGASAEEFAVAEAREEARSGEVVTASPPLSRGQSPASSGAVTSSPERTMGPGPVVPSSRHARSLSGRGPALPAVVEGQPARSCENIPAATEGEAALATATLPPPRPPGEGEEEEEDEAGGAAEASEPQDAPETAAAGACNASTGQEHAEFDDQPSMRKVGTFPCFHSAHSLAPEVDPAGDVSTPGTASTPRD